MPIVTPLDRGVVRLPCAGEVRAAVVVLHGYAARASLNVDDGAAFLDEHTEIVLPDAPGHGAREDGTLASIAALAPAQRTAAILALAERWAGELPRLVVGCRERGAERVGLVGISMGGLAAFAMLGESCPFDAVATVLAWPATADVTRLVPGSPPLSMGIAGRDAVVPAEPVRRFAAAYGAELREYPESAHHMRAQDWHDLWASIGAFLRRHLRPDVQREA